MCSNMRFILLVFTFIPFRILDVTHKCDRMCHISQLRLGIVLYAKKYDAGFQMEKDSPSLLESRGNNL